MRSEIVVVGILRTPYPPTPPHPTPPTHKNTDIRIFTVWGSCTFLAKQDFSDESAPSLYQKRCYVPETSLNISLIHILASSLHWACFVWEGKKINVFDSRHKEFIERELLMPVTNIKDGNLSTEMHDCKKNWMVSILLTTNKTNLRYAFFHTFLFSADISNTSDTRTFVLVMANPLLFIIYLVYRIHW